MVWSQHSEERLTRYYRSRQGERPAVFVQEEGQWRAYAANGAIQRSTGALPDAVLTRTVEITPAEGEALVAAWTARAEAIRRRQTAGTEAAAAQPVVDPSTAPAGPTPTVHPPSASARSRRPPRLIYVSAAIAVVIAGIVLAVLAATGHLTTGAKASTPGASSTNTTGSAVTSVASEDVVATIGVHVISRQRLEQKIGDFLAQYAAEIPDKKGAPDQYLLFERGVLDYLVTYQLVSMEAAALGLEVTEDDVATEMEFILDISHGGDRGKFESAVAEQGLTMEQFERIYRESLLFNKVYAEVTKTASATDGDSEALDAEQQQLWSDWLRRERQSAGVTYANGWAAPPTTPTTASALRPPAP